MDDATRVRLLSRVGRIQGVAYLELPVPLGPVDLSEDVRSLLGLDFGQPRDFADYLRETIVPEDRDAVDRCVRHTVSEGAGFDLRFRIRIDAGERLLHAVGEPEVDELGTVCQIHAVVVDVTPQHAEEEAERRRLLARFVQNILGAVPAALFVLDEEGRIEFVNDKVPLEMREGGLVGKTLDALGGGGEHGPRILEAARRLGRGPADAHEMWETELTYAEQDRVLQFFVAPLPAALAVVGRPAVLLAITDLTEQHQARAVLESHAEQLEAKVQARTEELQARARQQEALAQLGALALRSGFETVSRAALAMLRDAVGLEAASIVVALRHTHVALQLSTHTPAGLEVPLSVIDELEAATGAVSRPRPLHSNRPLLRSFPLRVDQETYGALCLHLDSTDDLDEHRRLLVVSVAHVIAEVIAREQTVLQLRHADRLSSVGRLTAGIAHQLGTPLNAISAHASLIARGRVDGEDVVASARAIEEQVERVSEQVRAVLDYARAGQLSTQRVDVRAVARSTVRVLEPLAASRRVALELELDEQPCWSSVPSQSLQQIITNLIDNGMDAQPGRGVVRIKVTQDDDAVWIRVEDDGEGIAQEVRGHIFDSFFTTKPAGKGTGLGLPVVRGLVVEARGTLSFASTVGSGTTFTVRLPSARSE